MEGFPLRGLQILFTLQIRKLSLERDKRIIHTHLGKKNPSVLLLCGWCPVNETLLGAEVRGRRGYQEGGKEHL